MQLHKTNNMEYNVFELLFKAELKRLKLRKKDVAKHLNLTMPTLKGRVEDPNTFKIKEVKLMRELGFDIETMYNIILFRI